jgi:hypothetical protein
MPLSFMPPNGAISVGDDALVDGDDPVSEAFGDAPDAADVAAVEIGGEPEFTVIGHLDRFIVGLEAVEWRHRPKGLLLGDDHVGRHIGQHRRLEEGAAECRPLAAHRHLGALLERVGAICASTFSTAFMSISGPITAPGSKPSTTLIAPAVFGELPGEASYTLSCTRIRLAHTQVYPALRYFEAMAPLTAISISASPKTINGAFSAEFERQLLDVGRGKIVRLVVFSVLLEISVGSCCQSSGQVSCTHNPIRGDEPYVDERYCYGLGGRCFSVTNRRRAASRRFSIWAASTV